MKTLVVRQVVHLSQLVVVVLTSFLFKSFFLMAYPITNRVMWCGKTICIHLFIWFPFTGFFNKYRNRGSGERWAWI